MKIVPLEGLAIKYLLMQLVVSDEFETDGKYKRVLKYPYRKENGVKV